MEIVYDRPLYKKDKRGRVCVWYAGIGEDDGGGIWYCTKSGLTSGAMKESSNLVMGTKTLSAREKCLSKIKSSYDKKLKGEYYDTVEAALEHVEERPMLLHRWDKYAHKMKYPAVIQPKLDGICAVYMDGEHPKFMSREGNEFEKLREYAKQIKEFLDEAYDGSLPGKDTDMHLHGELYIHGEPVAALVEWLKSPRGVEKDVKFFVFDCMPMWLPKMKYIGRLNELAAFKAPPFEVISTRPCYGELEAMATAGDYIEAGYEGAVVCRLDTPYEWGKRSYNKLKIKNLHSAEFPIVGHESEMAGDIQCIVFVCLTPEGNEFKVRPKGSVEKRARMWDVRDKLIGKLLTVEYRSLTRDKIPFHPVGVIVRDYE